MDSYGERIKAAREAAGMTQEELGAKLGVSGVTIMRYEKNQREPSINRFFELSDKLNVPIINLIGGFGALDPVLPPNMQGANIDNAKIDSEFMTYLLFRFFTLDENMPNYELVRENLILLARSSKLQFAEDILTDSYFEKGIHSNDSNTLSKMAHAFDRLNPTGKEKAVERVEELTEIPKYQKAPPQTDAQDGEE